MGAVTWSGAGGSGAARLGQAPTHRSIFPCPGRPAASPRAVKGLMRTPVTVPATGGGAGQGAVGRSSTPRLGSPLSLILLEEPGGGRRSARFTGFNGGRAATASARPRPASPSQGSMCSQLPGPGNATRWPSRPLPADRRSSGVPASPAFLQGTPRPGRGVAASRHQHRRVKRKAKHRRQRRAGMGVAPASPPRRPRVPSASPRRGQTP